MKFEPLNIKGIYKITLDRFNDHRGWFVRNFCYERFTEVGINFQIQQVNHSYTKKKGSFRGIHFQFGPFAEYKLVRCISGRVLDFAVDLRRNSDTLFQSVSVELSSENDQMILIPPGVGHAFQTLEDNSALIYLHSSIYNCDYEGGIKYNDSKLKLKLPLEITEISERDKSLPNIKSNFIGLEYEL
ncbi:MAG: dTDP-4-dehydrorhamnose 3,5-epimerase family protein [Chitinophagaceae bacterium]